MPQRTAREDSVIVGSMVRKDLIRALDSLDIMIEDEDGSISITERRSLRIANAAVQSAIRALNEVKDLTGFADLPLEPDGVLTSVSVPTTTLERLRTIWETQGDDTLQQQAISILRDLFDGQDGHLLRIDEALPVRA